MQELSSGGITRDEFNELSDEVVRDTIRLFEATGSPVITDGEQTKPSFATYPIHGLTTLAPDGVMIPEFSPTNRKSDRYEGRIAIEPGVPQPSLRWGA